MKFNVTDWNTEVRAAGEIHSNFSFYYGSSREREQDEAENTPTGVQA